MRYFYSDKIIEDNYEGYNNYNKSFITPVKCLYTIHPDKFKLLTNQELKNEIELSAHQYTDKDLIRDNLETNPFKK
ncbi:MAG: hypothetical protein IMY72_06145 [Bacteroidetes bacterium]|nr:hypothetical protein [Bacteroidota bacterium]